MFCFCMSLLLANLRVANVTTGHLSMHASVCTHTPHAHEAFLSTAIATLYGSGATIGEAHTLNNFSSFSEIYIFLFGYSNEEKT